MNKNLLLIGLLSVICIQSYASTTSEQLTSPDYVINSGYSEATAEEIVLVKNRIAGKPIEPLTEHSRNGFTRFMRNIFSYIDPTQDSDERLHHDIRQSTNWRDL